MYSAVLHVLLARKTHCSTTSGSRLGLKKLKATVVPQTTYRCSLAELPQSFLSSISFNNWRKVGGCIAFDEELPGVRLSDCTETYLETRAFERDVIRKDLWQHGQIPIVIHWPNHEPFRGEVEVNNGAVEVKSMVVSICDIVRQWMMTLGDQDDESVESFMARTWLIELRHVAENTWQPVFAQTTEHLEPSNDSQVTLVQKNALLKRSDLGVSLAHGKIQRKRCDLGNALVLEKAQLKRRGSDDTLVPKNVQLYQLQCDSETTLTAARSEFDPCASEVTLV